MVDIKKAKLDSSVKGSTPINKPDFRTSTDLKSDGESTYKQGKVPRSPNIKTGKKNPIPDQITTNSTPPDTTQDDSRGPKIELLDTSKILKDQNPKNQLTKNKNTHTKI
jgi:hypothetical protein